MTAATARALCHSRRNPLVSRFRCFALERKKCNRDDWVWPQLAATQFHTQESKSAATLQKVALNPGGSGPMLRWCESIGPTQNLCRALCRWLAVDRRCSGMRVVLLPARHGSGQPVGSLRGQRTHIVISAHVL